MSDIRPVFYAIDMRYRKGRKRYNRALDGESRSGRCPDKFHDLCCGLEYLLELFRSSHTSLARHVVFPAGSNDRPV